jgi:peptidase M42 family hydrolase
MKLLSVDEEYTLNFLLNLLRTPSPSGYTDTAVHYVCDELESLGVPFELTRRGAIRATLKGEQETPDRAIVAHIDTLGLMVKQLKTNGRLEVVPIGHWNARFAEGARVTIFADMGFFRGSVLPLKASGHTFAAEIDSQPVAWNNVEIRIDADARSLEDLIRLGINVGDFIAVDAMPEFTETGYINSRHLDDKAGVAVMMGAVKSLTESNVHLPVDCHLLFTISEEVGAGASAILNEDVAELVSIDNGTTAPGQNSSEFGVTFSMADMTGPFDYHLTRRLMTLCREFGIAYQRDVFKYYRSDIATALEAGYDIRSSLICFGVDGSHGYERVHWHSLESLIQLLIIYVQSPLLFERDKKGMASRHGFPTQPG